MSEELFKALMSQMRKDGRINDGEIGAVVPMDEAKFKWEWSEWANDAEEFYEDGLASVLEEVGIDPVAISKRFAENDEITEDDYSKLN